MSYIDRKGLENPCGGGKGGCATVVIVGPPPQYLPAEFGNNNGSF